MGLKHHAGIISFLLVPSSAVGVRGALRGERTTRAIIPAYASIVVFMAASMYYLGLRHGVFALLWGSLRYRLIIIMAGIYFILRSEDEGRKVRALIILATAELSTYMPLGLPLGHPGGLMIAVLAAGALSSVLHARGRAALSLAAGLLAIVFYSLLVTTGQRGLPERQPLTALPPHLVWIRDHRSDLYRTFGIPPGFSSVIDVRDFGTTQPIVPEEFAFFTRAVGGAPTEFYGPLWFHLYAYRGGKHTGYPLKDYLEYKSAWDLMGLKYLVVNRNTCVRDGSGCEAIESEAGISKVFEDEVAMVFESKDALPRVFAVTGWLGAGTEEEARRYVLSHIREIGGRPPVIEGAGPSVRPFTRIGPPAVKLVDYGANGLTVRSSVRGPHMLIVTDNYSRNWRAFVDGRETEVFRAYAMVRAVFVPGTDLVHTIRMVYRP